MTFKTLFDCELIAEKSGHHAREGYGRAAVHALVKSFVAAVMIVGPVSAQQSANSDSNLNTNARALSEISDEGYRAAIDGESEFDNTNDSYIKDWRKALPVADYQDTEFGSSMYNEPSVPTKLETLRLLSKDTPSMLVFLTAVSMGLDIESVLQASVEYKPDSGRDFASSAVAILPVLPVSGSGNYLYSSYEIEDLEREDESMPFSVGKVIERFFEGRQVLRPYPDWIEGQYHFLASAAELKQLQEPKEDSRWYRSKSTDDSAERPIFVSLYEATQSVLIDGAERVNKALEGNPEAQLPVVFVFNRLNERSLDELGYPLTIRGVKDAYTEKGLMITPAPEWQQGDYHFYAKMDEVDEVFNLPDEQDFEPEAWDALVAEAEDYGVTNTSFIVVVLGTGDGVARIGSQSKLISEYAAWDDPRTEQAYPFASSNNGSAMTLKSVLGQGVLINRPDLVAALKTLGVGQIPISFYYLDSSRVAPYAKGPKALIQAAIGAGVKIGTFGGEGGITPPPPVTPTPLPIPTPTPPSPPPPSPPPDCASPPCSS